MNLKKIFLFTFIVALLLSFTTYSAEKKAKVFNIDNEWTINFPKDWQIDKNEGYEQYYYISPPIPFYAAVIVHNYDFTGKENPDILATLKNKYPNSKIKEKKLDLAKFKLKDIKAGAYEYSFDENGTEVYAISCFILLEGNLLLVEFNSISKKETKKMLEYIYSIEKIN